MSYAIIGGLAVVIRGYDRFTQDIDAVLWSADDVLPELIASFVSHGFSLRSADGERFARQNRVLLLNSPQGRGVDLSLGALPFEFELIDRATQESIQSDARYPVASVEDLIIMKLIAGRDRDLDDVMRLTEIYPDIDRARIRKLVSEFAEILENPGTIDNLKRLVGGA